MLLIFNQHFYLLIKYNEIIHNSKVRKIYMLKKHTILNVSFFNNPNEINFIFIRNKRDT